MNRKMKTYRLKKREWMFLVVACAFVAWLMTISAHAGAFQDAQSLGAGLNAKASGAFKNQTVNSNTVPGYKTANPPQAAYQNNPGAMSSAASTATATDKTGVGKFIVHSAATRAQFTITVNDPLIKNATDIRKHAQQIAGIGASSNPGQCRNVTTTTPDLYRTYTCSNGKTSNVYSNPVCTTGRTPDVFSNHACTTGRTADVIGNHACTVGRTPDVIGNHACTRGRTPDIFSNHACTTGRTPDVIGNHACTRGRTPDIFSNHDCVIRNDPDTYSNHSCYTGHNPDIYKNETCTKTRPVTTSTCDRDLVVTAHVRQYCYWNQALGGTSMGGIRVTHQYAWWSGHVSITALCRSPGSGTAIYISGRADSGGSCDSFRGYRNVGHVTAYAQPYPTGWQNIGSLYYIGWSGYFYCFQNPPILMRSLGCSGNNCRAQFRVDMGTAHHACSDGSAVVGHQYRHQWCSGNAQLVYGYHCAQFQHGYCTTYGYGWYYKYPTIIQVPNYAYRTLSWTRNHNIISYTDQWVNRACR